MKLVTIPPTIGAAMRLITSDPVPLDHMIGKGPIRIARTVIILGVLSRNRTDVGQAAVRW